MGHVIVTTTSLLWVLLSIVSTLFVFSALYTPNWLIGQQKIVYENGTAIATTTPSVGVFNRCTRLRGENNCAVFALDGLATDPLVFPTFWKLSLVCFALGLSIMTFTAISSVLSCCVQSVKNKSIFTVTGTVQVIAGLFYILGLVMYAAGWGSTRVLRLCGKEAHPFYMGDCSLGWSVYLAISGTLLTLGTACLSIRAEKTTSSDRVNRHVQKGETLVCLL